MSSRRPPCTEPGGLHLWDGEGAAGDGASPPRSRRSSARPPLSSAGGAGTWAGAIPRPKNNGRELGRGRGEAAPQRLPGRGSGLTPREKM